jgi:hypothetical protein
MSRFSLSQKQTGSRFSASAGKTGSRFSVGNSRKSAGINLQGLAQQAGYGVEAERLVNKKPKLSVLQRLGSFLGAFETGNAVNTAIEQKSVGAGIGSYVGGVFKGIGSAVTGNDYSQTEKKNYKDIVEKMGVTNGIAKFGLGVAADILLDPTTYFGGALVKGAVKGTKLAGNAGLKTVGKFAPDVEKGVRIAGQGAKAALGKAFIFGYGTSKGLAEKTLETTSQISKAKEGIVRSNIDRLGTGTLSPSQQDELVSKLLEGKRTEFAVGRGTKAGKEAGLAAAKSSDPLVQKTIDEQLQRSGKFAQSAGVEDPFAVYFPGIAKDKLKTFFESTKSFRVGSESYRKEFKNLLKDDELVRNPAEAFARTEFNVAKDNIVRSQMRSMVNEFGKPLKAFKSEDEALKAGYRLIKEKGQFGKAVGYLKETDKKFLDNMISPEFSSIDAIAKHTGYDAITSLFKRSVTGLFAPFHVRNFVSGQLQNYEVLGAKALSPKNIATGQRIAYAMAKGKKFGNETIDIAGKSYKLDSMMEPFTKRFETSSQYIADIGDATANNALTKVKSFNPLSEKAIHFRAARAVGNFIETQQKATAYITALRDGKSVKEALELAARSGFDYRALTPFESKIMKRILPFYSFTRKNLELQLRTLGENPERLNNIFKIMRDAGNVSQEEKEGLPDYLREQFTFKFGESERGLPEIAAGLGTAVEQPGQVFGIRKLLSQVNPLPKAVLERGLNMDFFRNRKLSEVVEAGEYGKAPELVKNFLQVSGIKKTDKNGKEYTAYNANPYRLHLLRMLPSSRAVNYLSSIYQPTSPTSKALNLGTGVKPKEIDLETVKYFRDRDNQKELEDLLVRAGVLKRFEKVYQPK